MSNDEGRPPKRPPERSRGRRGRGGGAADRVEHAGEGEPGFGTAVRARELPAKAEVRRARRKPRAKRTVAELVGAVAGGEQAFKDQDLRRLRAGGWFDELHGLVKGGKEATVYLVTRGDTRLAAKVYADLEARSFRSDAPYWEGLEFEDERLARVLKRRSRAGKRAKVALWVMREYSNLWRLHRAGVRVPVPALPAEPSAWAAAGAVVLMEFVGVGDDPAPRLADLRLERAEAQAAFEQAAAAMVDLTRLGLVHGDLSTYNLLWHEGRVVIIDVPQLMDLRSGPFARELLERDLTTLAATFGALGADVDPADLRRRVEAALPVLP